MKLKDLNRLIKSEKSLNQKIKYYNRYKIIRRQILDKNEVFGHIEKSKHNLKFIQDNLKLGYFDWCITGCYYAVYHAALALILLRGHLSKNHDATLCLLIKEYYNRGINKEDIVVINKFFLDYQDLLFYAQSKDKREMSTYSSNYKFDYKEVEKLRLKTIVFINKIVEILEDEIKN